MHRSWVFDLLSFVWIIPAFTQRHGRFKYYFYLLAFAAAGGEFVVRLYYNFHINIGWVINDIYIFVLIFTPFTLLELNKIPKWKYWLLLSIVLGIAFGNIPHSNHDEVIFMFVIQFLVTGLVIRVLYLSAINAMEIDIWMALLLSYQFSILLQFFYDVAGTSIGYYNVDLFIKFEILLGIFFCFVKERSKYLIFRIKE